MDPRNRQWVSCNGWFQETGNESPATDLWVGWPITWRLIAYFSDPLQETHCLFLGSLYTDNLSLISYFRLEEGQQLIFHPVYSAYKGNIFDIWKNLFRWQGPFNKAKLSSTGTGLAYWNWACNNLRLSTRYLLTKYDHFQADLYFSEWVGGVGGWGVW